MSRLAVTIAGHTFEVEVKGSPRNGGSFPVTINGETVNVVMPGSDHTAPDLEWLIIDGRPYELVYNAETRGLRAFSGLHRVQVRDMEASFTRPPSSDGRVKAPIPGLIARVLVSPGDMVEVGQPLFTLEAMKMENEIRSPASGTVVSLHVEVGQSVARNELMAEIE